MKRWVSVLLIVIIIFGMSIVSFAQERAILALGDSITAGYGLDDREAECFVGLMAAEEGHTVINKAVDGNKAEDIIAQLTDSGNENYISQEAIESADIITITCGGNDMMALLYEKIAEEYPNVHPRKKKITADQVLGQMASKDLYAIAAALNVLNKDKNVYYMNDGDFDIRLMEFVENLLWITEHVRNLNPDAKIVVATQYNPYVEFKTTGYKVLYYGIEDGATRLNEAIVKNAEAGGYFVADVKSSFDAYTGDADLYNATPIEDINLDFHPTKDGHVLIAEVFGKIISDYHYLGVEMADGSYVLPDNVAGYYITDREGSVRLVDAGIYEKADGERVEEVYVNVSMVNGAQVKLTGSGLRFLAVVDRSMFDAEYGMLITSEGSDEKIFVDAKAWQSDTCFTVAIENIAAQNYARDYTATPFVRVTYENGEERIIYGTDSVTRSIYTVANGLLQSGEIYDEDVTSALKAYVNAK